MSPAAVSAGPRMAFILGESSDPKNGIHFSGRCALSLEHLVPPLLQGGVVLGDITVVEIDKARLLFGGEADALLQVGRNCRIGDGRVVAHVDREIILRALVQHRVHVGVAALLVWRVLRNHEAGDVHWHALDRRNGLHADARVLPLHHTRLPHNADANLLGLERLGEGLVGGIDTRTGFLQREQHLLAAFIVRDLPALSRHRGSRHYPLILDVDNPDLVAVLGIERILEALWRVGNELWIVDSDLARIDMPDPVRVFHRRDDVRGIRKLRIIDLFGNARLIHLVHKRRGEALDIARAARQPPFGEHLAAAGRVIRLILRHLVTLRLENRILHVLREQARIVTAPSADHDGPARGTRAAQDCGCREGAKTDAECATPREFSRHSPSSVFVQFSFCANTMPASRCQATVTSSPTAIATSPRFASCTTTRSAAERRTCNSSTAPRYETNSTLPGMALSIPFAPPRCSRSGRSSSDALPGAPSRHLSCSPPAVSN